MLLATKNKTIFHTSMTHAKEKINKVDGVVKHLHSVTDDQVSLVDFLVGYLFEQNPDIFYGSVLRHSSYVSLNELWEVQNSNCTEFCSFRTQKWRFVNLLQ